MQISQTNRKPRAATAALKKQIKEVSISSGMFFSLIIGRPPEIFDFQFPISDFHLAISKSALEVCLE
jgi:hypothetical protein